MFKERDVMYPAIYMYNKSFNHLLGVNCSLKSSVIHFNLNMICMAAVFHPCLTFRDNIFLLDLQNVCSL